LIEPIYNLDILLVPCKYYNEPHRALVLMNQHYKISVGKDTNQAKGFCSCTKTKPLQPDVHNSCSHFRLSGIKNQALCMLANLTNKTDNSMTSPLPYFQPSRCYIVVQQRFHLLPVGQNKSLVIYCSATLLALTYFFISVCLPVSEN